MTDSLTHARAGCKAIGRWSSVISCYDECVTSVLTVTELTRRLREILETRIGSVWVEGEVSNFRKQSSGHQYFTLKDQRAQLSCVMFARSYGAQSKVQLADGMHVQVFGPITVYEARGQYQMTVQLVQQRGQGALQAKFEALKRKLEAEGLFEASRKRTLPRFPRKIAIVTSPSGAALQDMLNILQRRSPWLRILICPVRVQGAGAAQEIALMIQRVNEQARARQIDVMIVGRGGGSLEDLWEFNEEVLARAIAGSAIPVVSAVGHEIDFAIADFVADLRAPTPSAAAELIAPDYRALAQHLSARRERLVRCVQQGLEVKRLRLRQLTVNEFLREPQRIFLERQQSVDQRETRLAALLGARLGEVRMHLARMRSVLAAYKPSKLVQDRRHEVLVCAARLRQAANISLAQLKTRAARAEQLVQLLGPQQTLDRGYSITTDQRDQVITSAAALSPGQLIRTRLADGKVESEVAKQIQQE